MIKMNEFEVAEKLIDPLIPLYLNSLPFGGFELYAADKFCTDCRLRGTIVKPDYW